MIRQKNHQRRHGPVRTSSDVLLVQSFGRIRTANISDFWKFSQGLSQTLRTIWSKVQFNSGLRTFWSKVQKKLAQVLVNCSPKGERRKNPGKTDKSPFSKWFSTRKHLAVRKIVKDSTVYPAIIMATNNGSSSAGGQPSAPTIPGTDPTGKKVKNGKHLI